MDASFEKYKQKRMEQCDVEDTDETNAPEYINNEEADSCDGEQDIPRLISLGKLCFTKNQ